MTAALADPAHAKSVTPNSRSAQYDLVSPLVGSASTLVFVRAHRLARDADTFQGVYPNPSGRATLYARSTAGKLKALGTEPDESSHYSLAGTVMTAGNYLDSDGDDGDILTTSVYEWDTTTGVRHAVTLPADSNYLAAAPNGVVFVAGQAVKVRTLAGTTSTLATPFGTASTDDIVSGVSDSDGVVVTNQAGKIAFIPFAAPHTVVALASPTTSQIDCAAVAGAYAACTSEDNIDGPPYTPDTAYLVPINGDPVTMQATACDLVDVTVAGSDLFWGCATPAADSVVVHSQPAGSTTVTTAAVDSYGELSTAYGDAVVSTPDQRSVLSGSAADNLTTLIRPGTSPVSVDEVAVAGKTIVYTDDQRVASRDGRIVSAFTRSAAVKHSTVKLGSQKLLSATAHKVTGGLVGASTSTVVYATDGAERNHFPTSVLHVRYKGHESTVSNVIAYGQIQVSGARVLYEATRAKGSTIDIYNAASKKTKVERTIKGFNDGTALSGHYIAYATNKGAIQRKNLKTGKVVTVAAKQKRAVPGVTFSVYLHGNWVGWTAQPVSRELPDAINDLRNAKTLGKTIKLHHTLYSLTSAGALLDASATQDLGFAEPDGVAHPTAFWLRSYSGHSKKVLSKQVFVTGPQVAGKVIAWAGSAGVLKVAPLP